MSVTPSEHERAPAGSAPADSPAAPPWDDWRAEWQEFEDFVQQVLEELDEVRGLLERKAHAIALAEARLAEREAQLNLRAENEQQLSAAFQRQEAQLAEAIRALDRLQAGG